MTHTAPQPTAWIRWQNQLLQPVAAGSLQLWRVLFGLLLAGALVRTAYQGWLDQLYLTPQFHFRFLGLAWLPQLSGVALYGLVAALVGLALCLAAGWHARKAAALFAAGFLWLESQDVSNYLNHYWLVTLLAGLCAVVPWQQASQTGTVPRWVLWLLRAQIALVYTHAGLAKIQPDWLLHGQPLGIWLAARADLPVIGPWLAIPQTALVFAWCGMLYDSSIAWLLLWPRTRWVAMGLVVAFHTMTHLLFNIGIFPLLMTLNATLLLAPDWPQQLRRRLGFGPTAPNLVSDALPAVGSYRLAWVPLVLAAVFVVVQAVVPLRHFAISDNVLWDEAGMRWSWKVMLREKHGSVQFRVAIAALAKPGQPVPQLEVSPTRWLDSHQEREMASQPDLILQLAQHIGRHFAARGYGQVAVYADAVASLNGRPPARLIDPHTDLTQVSDSLGRRPWVPPAPSGPPLPLRASALALR